MKQKLAAKEEDTAENLRERMTFFQRYCTSRFYVLFVRMEGSIKQGLSRRRNPNFQPIRSHRVCQDSIWASRSCRNLGSGTSGHQLEVLTLLTACILKKWKWVEFWYKFLKLVVRVGIWLDTQSSFMLLILSTSICSRWSACHAATTSERYATTG
ncbi:uncharacterized protein LOC113330415 isoform X1 [Papaver somniferum]|uniref:uncharacterized protein LOC113330415 isoform X1 n=1 Tax=Papaver somniferum TaxID=3469 RepID=UPI000E6F8464|nr:uncharacterized protein LOC113330415 isoform X1 [Papaver somniferum]XP_026433013.1 uncharacterized protein LOC113330415 isoform X1 [Papaver somniferum]XP_026433014.1 uncharacterized protein LOC113330415 isoform X1 [Papaver somniferum]